MSGTNPTNHQYKYHDPDEAYAIARRRIMNNAVRRHQFSIDLSGYGFVRLPPEIGEAAELRSLDLSGNMLSTLPPEIGNLTELRWLNASGNRLNKLPKEIALLSALGTLILNRNSLSDLPPEMQELRNLHLLYLSNNNFLQFPALLQLKELRSIDLDDNQIEVLPPEISELTQLQDLYLSRNRLTSLCPEISRLGELRALYLSSNRFDAFPQEILDLRMLEDLVLNGNQLTLVPADIARLAALQYLDFSNNQLKALPAGLGQLRSLEEAALTDSEPRHMGLWFAENLLPEPYPVLLALDQPSMTVRTLAYLRGELDLEELRALLASDQRQAPSVLESENAQQDELDLTPQQRPAAFRFGVRNGKIDTVPERADIIDRRAATDLYNELLAKVEALSTRVARVNVEPRVQRSIDRLLIALGSDLEDVRPGIILSCSRSIAMHSTACRDVVNCFRMRSQ